METIAIVADDIIPDDGPVVVPQDNVTAVADPVTNDLTVLAVPDPDTITPGGHIQIFFRPNDVVSNPALSRVLYINPEEGIFQAVIFHNQIRRLTGRDARLLFIQARPGIANDQTPEGDVRRPVNLDDMAVGIPVEDRPINPLQG